MDNFIKLMKHKKIVTEIQRDEFKNVSTNKNRIDITIDLYGKTIYGFKTANFFYFKRLGFYYYIPLQIVNDDISIDLFKTEEENKTQRVEEVQYIINNLTKLDDYNISTIFNEIKERIEG